MQRSILLIAVVAAVVGAGAAVGIVEGLGARSSRTTTTLVQQAPLGTSDNASNDSDSVLTAGEIYKRDAPGVVFVRSQIVQRTQSPFDFGLPQEQHGEATGSGFVIDKTGTILTNAHVVNGASKVTVQFEDKQSVDAKVLGKDESTDLALLAVNPEGLSLVPLTLGSSKAVQVGDPAIAIGNPFGLERTLTTGVISAVQRTIQAPNSFEIDDVLQTDAPINPGNSGGPLIDATGKVIGINSQIATGGSGSNGSVGIGFAVPIDTAKTIIPDLKQSGRVDRGYLGVDALTVDKTLKDVVPVAHGALVQKVAPGGPAEKAGIRAGDLAATLDNHPIQLGGDIITKVAGKDIRSDNDLEAAVANRTSGERIKVTVVRSGKVRTVEVTLGERPNTVTAGQP
ncbi:MAG TPA: trypsin-like peptidase domain-containing protein [Baekduia sp.]|nr:trypsin-like peptidase domain-containing protein [Baekduia sp.]